MTTTCQNCSGKTADAYLCARCCDRLRDTLAKLPALLEALTDAAVGAVKMGDNGGRKSARKTTLEVAKSLGTVTGTGDHEDQRARTAREAMLRRALASGGCNADASLLLGGIADELHDICRRLCDERGLTYEPPRYVGTAFIGPLRQFDVRAIPPATYGVRHVHWLYANVQAIALSEEAGDIYGDICGRTCPDRKYRPGYSADIEAAIDRPTRWIALGTCHAPVRVEGPAEKGMPHPTVECGAKLRADSDQTHVRCPRCKELHQVAQLRAIQMSDVNAAPLTWEMLCKANRDQEPSFRVPDRTLRMWRHDGDLMPAAIDDKGEPLYRWADVQKVKADKRRGPKPKKLVSV